MWRSRRPLASTSTSSPTAISASTYFCYYTSSSPCSPDHGLHPHRRYHQHRNRNHNNHSAGAVGAAVGRQTLSPPPQRLQRRCWSHTATTHVHTSSQKPLPTYFFLPSTPANSAANSTTNPATGSTADSSSDHKPSDERTLALGRTIRTLQERMPTLLQSPLPTEILSPSISLHLFPSTHPHLPAVRGRVAYIAALWTAPVAWGRLPGGNTTLQVVSERMLVGERLRIRWRAASPPPSSSSGSAVRLHDGSYDSGSSSTGEKEEREKGGTTAVGRGEFSGIFVFEFDEAGRVCKHIIENCEEDDGEKVPGVISVTEWLIRKARGEPAAAGGGGGKLGGLAWQFQRK